MRGTVKTFSSDRGFGFIVPETGEDVFFHISDFRDGGNISAGSRVKFDIGRNSKGSCAKNIRYSQCFIVRAILGMVDRPKASGQSSSKSSSCRSKFFTLQDKSIRTSNIKSFSLESIPSVELNGSCYYHYEAGYDDERKIRYTPSESSSIFPDWMKDSLLGKFFVVPDKHLHFKKFRQFGSGWVEQQGFRHSLSDLKSAGIDVKYFDAPVLVVLTFQNETYRFSDIEHPDRIHKAYNRVRGYMS